MVERPIRIEVTPEDVERWFTPTSKGLQATVPDAGACSRLAAIITTISGQPGATNKRLGERPVAKALLSLRDRIEPAKAHWASQPEDPNFQFQLERVETLERVLKSISPDLLLEDSVVDIELGRHAYLRFLYPYVVREWKAAGNDWGGRDGETSPGATSLVCVFLAQALSHIGYKATPNSVRLFIEDEIEAKRLQLHQKPNS